MTNGMTTANDQWKLKNKQLFGQFGSKTIDKWPMANDHIAKVIRAIRV